MQLKENKKNKNVNKINKQINYKDSIKGK